MTVYTLDQWLKGKIKKHECSTDEWYERSAGSILFIKSKIVVSVHEPDDWAETEEEARDMLLARKEKRIQSLRKQIAKLEALTEWEVQ